jgi:hypothetical protein
MGSALGGWQIDEMSVKPMLVTEHKRVLRILMGEGNEVVFVVAAILVLWLRSVKPKRRI